YSLQPQVSDAQSIVSNVKHLQEKLLLTETKLKESEYQLAPWQSDVNHSNDSPVGVGVNPLSTRRILYMIKQPWSGILSAGIKMSQFDDSRRFSPLVTVTSQVLRCLSNNLVRLVKMNLVGWKQVEDTPAKHVQFLEPLSKIVMEDAKGESDNTKNSPYVPAFDDPPSSSNSPLFVSQPSSSSDEMRMMTVASYKDLQIQESLILDMSFRRWVCSHLEDGSVNYIDGAKQPNYLVTADDFSLDDRNRKGQLVKVFANENRKIACHPEMQSHIEKTLHSGHASYKVSVSVLTFSIPTPMFGIYVFFDLFWINTSYACGFEQTGFLNIWEEAMLSIKREGYSIKCSNDIMVAEKFSSSTSVTIPFGQPEEFVITGSNGTEYTLRGDHGSADLCWWLLS
ncbi:hypothetical protein HID58_032070, partial [Brassica napus]